MLKKYTKEELRFYISNIVIAILLLVFFFYTHSAFAQVSSYTRTPADTEIPEGTTINFSGWGTFPDNVESVQLRVDGEFSSCIDTANSDEQSIDVDMVLPVADYNNVDFLGYNGVNDCSNDPYVLNFETGSPAFSVVVVPDLTIEERQLLTSQMILAFGVFFVVSGFVYKFSQKVL